MDISLPEENRRCFAFAAITGLIGIVLSIIRLDVVWTVTSLVYLRLIYGVSSMKREDNIQRDLYKWTPLPVFFGMTGISSFFQGKFVFGDLAFAVILPILGFMIVLNLTYHTEFRTNLTFSAFFIFLFTLAAGGALGIGQFLSDSYLGTEIIRNNEYLMIELLIITGAGLIGSYSFKNYREKYYLKWEDFSILNEIRSSLELNSKTPREDLLEAIYSFFGNIEDDRIILVSKFLQIGIIVTAVYSAITLNFRVVGLAIPSFGASLIPYVYSRKIDKDVPASFQFWISISLFLYVAGESAKFQVRFIWWNNFTHFLGGIIVGVLIYISLFYLNQISENLFILEWMPPLLALMSILSISVLWELFEFSIDTFFSTTLQSRLENSTYDMIFNTIGTIFALMLISLFTPFKVFKAFKKKL